MDEKTKSEFIQNLEQTATALTEAVTGKDSKGVILLGVETTPSEDGTEENTNAVIAIAGHGKQIIEVLAQFISNPQTKPLFEEAMKVAAAKHLRYSLKNVVEALADSSKTDCSTNKE